MKITAYSPGVNVASVHKVIHEYKASHLKMKDTKSLDYSDNM